MLARDSEGLRGDLALQQTTWVTLSRALPLSTPQFPLLASK